MNGFFKNYGATLLLLAGILLGALCGALWPAAAHAVKPLGELFLNLIFVMVVPLVFFSIANSICGLHRSGMLGKTLLEILFVFVGMSLIAALVAFAWVRPSALSMVERTSILNGASTSPVADVEGTGSLLQALTDALTVSDFGLLLSKEHLLPLIVFAALLGYAVCAVGEKARAVEDFLQGGSEVMIRMMKGVMVAAPVGLGCYFASTIASVGSELLGVYLQVFIRYLILTVIFFCLISVLYVSAARGRAGNQAYWRHIWDPAATAVATSSSAATMPVAIEAAKRMGVSAPIAESVIPLGTNIHKDGSVMAAVFKIVFLMLLCGRPIGGFEAFALIIGVALLEAIVLGAVPGGGMAGEIFICSVMGFPPEMVGIIVIIGTIVDMPATLLNVNGNIVASILVDRLAERRGRRKDEI